MQDSELRAWLALHRTPHLSTRALGRLISTATGPDEIISFSPAQLKSLQIHPAAIQAITSLNVAMTSPQLDRDWRQLQQLNIQLIPLSHPDYPELLKQIADPPPLLYVRGRLALLNKPQLAMVGSRKPSAQGRENAFCFAGELSRAGFVVTSGLALGIDTESHRGALASGGDSIAVLGTGVDRVYPARNRLLHEELIEGGAIISEFPLGTEPRRNLFPQRNRIISGMSLGVLVVEAALKSGSLITARCALEQNREVFAIPGSIHNPASCGCHWLIQQGAVLVQGAREVMGPLQGWLPTGLGDQLREVGHQVPMYSQQEQSLLDWLGYDPATIDQLQQRSGWPIAELNAHLVGLEIKGAVVNQGGNYQRHSPA